MKVGGPCIGCTMPGFPDKFAPFYKTPPGAAVSSNTSRVLGFGIRSLRALSNHDRNREVRWDKLDQGQVPSGWGNVGTPGVVDKTVHYFYEKLQFQGSKKPGRQDDRDYATDLPPRAKGMEVPRDKTESSLEE